MYKMLIVDDEYYTREGMKKIIDWNSMGIDIVGTAENGIQGIEKVKELMPDIILTDIRMKAMDGLAMIDALREEGIVCKFIIMSGYKVFEYAKKALEGGVDFYLLKPVSKEELLEAVQKIIALLDQEKISGMSKKLEESESVIKKLLGMDKEGKGTIMPSKQLTYSNYIVIRFLFVPSISFAMGEKLDIYNKLLRLRNNIYILFKNDSELLVHLYDDASPETAVKKLRLTLIEMLKCKVFAGASDSNSKPEEFNKAYNQAGIALKYILYYGEAGVIRYSDIEKHSRKMGQEFIDFQKGIIHAVETCDREKVRDEFNRVKEEIEKFKYDPEEVWNFFRHYYLDLKRAFTQMNIDLTDSEEVNEMEGIVGRIQEISLPELTEALIGLTINSINAVEASRRGYISKKIRDVVAYIDNHYTEDISLERLEAMFYTEFSYISKLFKKEMGVSYLQYITEKRLLKAKELMDNPDLTLYQIANGVGYTDAKYFSQLFKKMEGLTPKEYRENRVRKMENDRSPKPF